MSGPPPLPPSSAMNTTSAQSQSLPQTTLSQQAVRSAAFAILAYILFSLALPLVPFHLPGHRNSFLLFFGALILPTTFFMLLQLWLGTALVRLRLGLRPTLLLGAGAIALWFIALLWVHPYHGFAPRANFSLALLRPLLAGLFVTLACTFFGMGLSRIVREPNVLLPVALVAMPIDYIGAMTNIGFTHTVVQKHPNIVQAVSVPVPTVGGLHPIGYIGPGDALFIAFFLAAVLRLDLNFRGTFWWMYGLLTITMLVVLYTAIPVAALVPMGLAVLIANGRLMRLQRSEVFATIYAVVLILAIVTGFYAYSHARFFRH